MSDRLPSRRHGSALKDVTRGMKLRYGLTFGLVVLTAVMSVALLDRLVTIQDSYATTINVSGRQRMLLQRTARLARQLTTTKDAKERGDARRELRQFTGLMRSSHLALVRGSGRMNLTAPRSAAVSQILFGAPVQLDRQVQSYLANLDYLLAMDVRAIEPNDPQLLDIHRQASGRLATSLDAVVKQYEREARAEVRQIELVQAGFLAMIVLLMIVDGVVVFRPMVRDAGTKTRNLLRAHADLRRMAFRDPLTELPNRRLFSRELTRSIETEGQAPAPFALLQLDLDNFKHINDTLGHAAGDFVLKETARRIRSCIRASDTVARLGGDEFAVLLKGIQCQDAVSAVADKMLLVLSKPFVHANQTIHVSASIGITMCPTDDREPEQLWKNADIALHISKSEGRGTYCLFDSPMREEAEQRQRVEAELRRAIADDELVLYYQPMCVLSGRGATGFEVLLRWQHPERGLLSPIAFLEVAEDSGLVGPIGDLVLQRGMAQLATWLDQGFKVDRMAFNLAAVQLRSRRIVETLKRQLADTDVPVQKIELEVTEGVFMGRGADSVVETLCEVHDLGLPVALDDFGTGYGSLTQLRQFPIDRLKIDRSFVQDIGTDRDGMAIVQSVIGLGHSLSMKVTAEGVETQEQLDFLRHHKCDEAQGFLIGKPGPACEATAFLRREHAGPAPREAAGLYRVSA